MIKTDSRALTLMESMREARGIWARWQVYISSFNFDIVHHPSKDNIFAYALSRVIPQIRGEGGRKTTLKQTVRSTIMNH